MQNLFNSVKAYIPVYILHPDIQPLWRGAYIHGIILSMETKTEIAITASLSGVLAALFIWRALVSDASLLGVFTGAALALLFVFCLIRFVHAFGLFHTKDAAIPPDAALGERSLRRERRHPWAEIVMFMLITRVFLYVAAYAAYYIARDAYPGGIFDTLRTIWLRSDSPSYLGISERWYVTVGDPRFHIVFFPFYPVVCAPLNLVTGNSFASAMIVSNLSSVAAAILAYETAALDMPRGTALRAMKYLFILPAAFFFAAPMTEGLFVLLCLACVYLVRKKHYLFGCIFGALAGFTRSVGGLLIIFAFSEWLYELLSERRAGTLRQNAKTHVLRALCLLIIPCGLLGYLYINYAVTGSPFTFMKYQSEHWSQGFGFFFESAATQIEHLVSSLGAGDLSKVFGLWLPNLVYSFGALAIVYAGSRKLRPSYTAFFLVYFVVACGATWLLSSPRYLTAAFPLAFAMASITDTPKRDTAATLICLVLLVLYLAMYANGQYVY